MDSLNLKELSQEFYKNNEVSFSLEGVFVEIFENSDNEIEYNLYKNPADWDDANSFDGGGCTGSFADAVEMAVCA
jgi:hypothetical protein